jgi:hypothetical protein
VLILWWQYLMDGCGRYDMAVNRINKPQRETPSIIVGYRIAFMPRILTMF